LSKYHCNLLGCCLYSLAVVYGVWSVWLTFCYFKVSVKFHSFLWHMQNAMIPCRTQELLPFLSVIYFFLPRFSANYSSIVFHLILPSISWSTSQSCCSQIHIQWKPLLMITLGPALFYNNNWLITLSGGYKTLHYLTQFIVTTFYMYKKQQNLF
jgi:hypothetical protein